MTTSPAERIEALFGQRTKTAAADVASDPRPAAVTASDPAPPAAPPTPTERIAVGALVAWPHAGAWQYGLVQGVTQREGRAYVRPIANPRDCWPKLLDDLTLISDRAGLLRSIQAAHAELAQ